MAETYSAGIVTAYGAAKRGGYTGTYEEFCIEQAGFAEAAQQVRRDKESVEQTVDTFSEETVPAAVRSVTDEGTRQIGLVNDAGDDAVEAVENAGTENVSSVNRAGSTQVGNVNSAGTTQVGNVNQAGATQVQAVEDKGEEVLESIPADYTALDAKVTSLNQALSEVESAIEPWTSYPYDNLFYGIATVSYNADVSTAVTEYALTSSGVHLEANHKYLAYYEFEIGEDIGTWTSYTSFVPYLRNLNTYTNIATADYHVETFGSSTVGDKLTIYGFYTPSEDLPNIGGRMMSYNGGTNTRRAHWIYNKVYIIDVTGITDYSDILASLEVADGNQKLFGNSELQKISDKTNYLISQNIFSVSDLLCWGDSLTAGVGGSGTTYPQVCASELGITSLNCGVGGENCQTIAARQGGNNVVIPAGSINGTYSSLTDIMGNSLAPLLQGNGNGSGNKLIIDGQVCNLSYASSNYTISGYTGSAKTIPTLARFYGSDYKGNIVAFWIGTNGGAFPGLSAGVDVRIAWLKSMIKHIEHDRYVILGIIAGEGTNSFYVNEENKMKQEFGNKYFPTRQYLVENGLTIAGITPTEQDTADISVGKVPSSLRSDQTHLNASGYTALGKMLANKIKSLGYI